MGNAQIAQEEIKSSPSKRARKRARRARETRGWRPGDTRAHGVRAQDSNARWRWEYTYYIQIQRTQHHCKSISNVRM